jgi:hypothetical protein
MNALSLRVQVPDWLWLVYILILMQFCIWERGGFWGRPFAQQKGVPDLANFCFLVAYFKST